MNEVMLDSARLNLVCSGVKKMPRQFALWSDMELESLYIVKGEDQIFTVLGLICVKTRQTLAYTPNPESPKT